MSTTDCIFCRIIANEVPSERVYEDESVIAFRDLAPKAPVHVLVVPREHVRDVTELAEQPELLAAVTRAAAHVADQEANGEFRFIFNTGETAGQTVFHAHGHVLAGTGLPEGDM